MADQSRAKIFNASILVLISILGLQLFWLQIVNKDQFQELSKDNTLRDVRTLPARGAIYDRNGTLLVDNEPAYIVTLTPRYFDESKTALLSQLLGIDDTVVTARLKKAAEWNSYRPSPSFRNADFNVFSRIRENAYLLPGVGHEISQRRRYVSEARAAHALGYMREITQDELDVYRKGENERRYRQGDLTGKTGIERQYEPQLRGTPGSAFRIINVYGIDVKSYQDGSQDRAPTGGLDIHLALDENVQALAESLFVNKRGAAVALDVATGGVIAMVSMPDFDSAVFSTVIDRDIWSRFAEDEDTPLYNRATMNRMPPGSTWKPFMALLALSEGYIEPDGPASTVFCPGYHPVGKGLIFRCLGEHGALDVREALMHSCNTFFFEMARRMDVNTFRRYANQFGFGRRVPTDIAEQTPGLIPDSAYFNRIDPRWNIGYSTSLGVGQGDMGVTPLQLARYTAAIANGGTLHTPHLVAFIRNPETGEQIRPEGLSESKNIPIDERYFAIVREGMRRAMEEGTGYSAQIPGIPSGGKTGTAQAPGNRIDHSVFVMFAPFDDPQIAIAVQCENAGPGTACAAPIASLMAEQYLKGYLPASAELQVRLGYALSAVSQDLTKPDEE